MREQTPLEEKYNYQSHGFGFVLSIIAFVLLLLASKTGSYSTLFASGVYGLSLCILYFCSAKYHHTQDPVKKLFYRKLDHISIYVLIAGTYTPYTLIFLSHSKGVLLFGL
jgi:hemolysin III